MGCDRNASNLVIHFRMTSHPSFVRSGDDLYLTHDITLEDALKMTPATITKIDGRQLVVSPNCQMSP